MSEEAIQQRARACLKAGAQREGGAGGKQKSTEQCEKSSEREFALTFRATAGSEAALAGPERSIEMAAVEHGAEVAADATLQQGELPAQRHGRRGAASGGERAQ